MTDRRLIAAVAAVALLIAVCLAATVALFWSGLDAAGRAAFGSVWVGRAPLVLMTWLAAVGAAAVALHRLFRNFVAAPARLAEQAQVLLSSDIARDIEPHGSRENRALTDAINTLARQRAQLRHDIQSQVQEASRDIERERSRLAALMSELTQSVVVCNLDGRVLLYNNRAREQFRALSQAPTLAGGAELIGLGRSIYTVFDRTLIAHALETIEQRMQRGAADPSAQFVTATDAGQLLRVQMAPVRGAPRRDGESLQIDGFVLMLDNITREYDDESSRDRVLQALTEGSRASLASMQAAVDLLDYPDLDAATRERFLCVVRDEVRAMSRRLQELAEGVAQDVKTRWPLEDMLGADLISAALRRIESLEVVRASADEVDDSLWLKVDSFSLLQALVYLAGRLAEEFELRTVQLRLRPAGSRRAHLDLVWSGQAISTETAMSWELDPMRIGEQASTLTVRDVVERHGGEFWFERERVRHQAFFRFLLPLASAVHDEHTGAGATERNPSHPEYDFDLFRVSEQSRELDERQLAELTYTVFDTETTGLDPLQGDEIIQIGAVRIVNGKLRRQESFEQLIDPRRPIPAHTIPIHGIQPEMVQGQPTIDAVLPAFHAFAQDTVLVAHNAAFDMRFLHIKQRQAGVRFDQPVLDTLLLSALIHPNQASHRLDAVAERFAVALTKRHTALGDAMVTAELLVRMIPLLAQRGIHTLRQAREAAEQTYHARLSR